MKKRKKTKLIRFILPLIFLFLIFSFIFLFRFKEIEVEPETFINYLTPYLKDKTLYEIFPNLKKIMKDFPEIKKIDLRANIFKQKLFLKIKSSEVIAQICDEKECFYLDNYGEIIEPRGGLTRTGTRLPAGRQGLTRTLLIYSFLPIEKNTLLNPEIKNLLSLLFEYANWKPLVLKEIKIYKNFDVGVIDSENREFLFDPSKNIEEQIKKLHIFLTKNFPGTRIDLRITKKIYFK
jgi:hypothetical protein